MIEQFYLIHKWDPINYCQSESDWIRESNTNREIFHISQTPELKTYHLILFSDIHICLPLRSDRIWHKVNF